MGTGISVMGSLSSLFFIFIFILNFVAKELQLLLRNVNMMTKI
jgi:hypothetical protein